MNRKLTSYLVRIILCMYCVFQLGCNSVAQPKGTRYQGLEMPALGMARIYVFRPAFESSRKKDKPKIYYDNKYIASLGWASYSVIDSKSGQFNIKIESDDKRQFWNSDFSVQVLENKVYFLAIWDKTARERDWSGALIGAIPALLGANYFFITSTYKNISKEVGIELLEKEMAEIELRECVYLEPYGQN